MNRLSRKAVLLSASLAALCATAQEPMTFAPFMMGQPSGAAVGITFLTNSSSTTDTTFYQTEEFTPGSNTMLVATFGWTTTPVMNAVTNTGTTNLVWWQAASTNTAAARSIAMFVTALPQGTAPFAMRVTAALAATPTSMQISVFEVTNANKTTLWGSNAITQVNGFLEGGPTAGRRLAFTNAPAVPNVCAMITSGLVTCTCSYTAIESPGVFPVQSAVATPATRFGSWFQIQLASGFVGSYVSNTGYIGGADENMVGIQIKP